MFFDGFPPPATIAFGDQRFRVRMAGSGPVVVLLHGHPQTHAMWHAVAPALAARFRVVCLDLPGYGGTPLEPAATPLAATKDAMARLLLGLLASLGIERFSIAGHDIGGRVAHRMALLAPSLVARLALLGIVPVPEPVERSDMAFALAAYRSFWFAQTHPKPEAMVAAAPEAWFGGVLPGAPEAARFHPEAVADYLAQLSGPEAVERLNETHRAATALDVGLDRMTPTAERRIACPLLVLWGRASALGGWYDPEALWRDHHGGTLEAHAVAGGHFLVEECPDEVGARLRAFFGAELSASA